MASGITNNTAMSFPSFIDPAKPLKEPFFFVIYQPSLIMISLYNHTVFS